MTHISTFSRLLRLCVLAVALGAATSSLAQDVGAAVVTEHTRASLLLSRDVARPGETIWAALKLELQPGWHTYWRNPGDSGLPAAITWSLPAGVSAGEIAWPTPERVPYGPLMNFGYSNLVYLPVPLTLPASASAPESFTLEATATWLVCAEICVPDEGSFRVSLTMDPDASAASSVHGPEIDAVLARLPKQAPWPVTLTRQAKDIAIAAGPGFPNADPASVMFFPHDPGLIENAAPQRAQISAGTLSLTAMVPEVPLDMPAQTGGLIVIREGASQVAYAFNALVPPMSAQSPDIVVDVGLWSAVIFAFLGGLILNLMPCVLPVLAMKALALASKGEDGAAARRSDGFAYTIGVMVTFGILAALLIGLRGAGSEIGWGFQLQSPAFVSIIAYVMLVLGLNLSGVFAIGGGIMGAGQSLTQRSGKSGAFFTGALAVVVATPCTAPFMGAAVGYAMTQPTAVTVMVFESLALGLAAPFLLFSLVPQAAKILPRPGAWMTRLKQVLAFPMYASAAWLVWVLSQQLGADGFASTLAGFILIALAAWLLGVTQDAGRFGVSTALSLAAFIGALALIATLNTAPAAGSTAQSAYTAGSEAYSPQRLDELRAEGRTVFVNFTAAWCITCLMNERVALSTAEVKQALADGHVAYLKADWTNRDPAIAKALASFGRSGVPLYVVYRPDGSPPEVLPQLLTPSVVLAAIRAK